MALGVGPGDEVITVANTAVPTVSAIRMVRATPVFADVDPETSLMDLSLVPGLITSKTRAIIPVHLFGNAVNMPLLLDIARPYNIPVVEDCAEREGINSRLDEVQATASNIEHAYHLFVVRSKERNALRAALASHNIQTGIHYPFPIHRMRGYTVLGYQDQSLPITETLANEIVSLPLYPELPLESAHRVLDTLHEILD